MTQSNAPFGGRPVRYLNGSPYNGACRAYYAPADYGTALYVGDPVVITGYTNDTAFQGFDAGFLSEVNLGAAGDATAFTGFVVGFNPVSRESLVYKPASTEAIVYVADDPNLVYWMQDDGGGTLGYDTVGLNANLIAGSGSTTTGRSGWAIDGGTSDGPAADASNQLSIIGVARIPGNDPTADYCIWEVKINQQTYVASGADRGLGIA